MADEGLLDRFLESGNEDEAEGDIENDKTIDVWHYVRRRVELEVELAREQALQLFVCLIVLFYGAMMVFRNLAFYRFEGNGKQLKDAGFEVLPEIEFGAIGDLPMYAVSFSLIVLCAYTLRPPREATGDEKETLKKKPFVFNMLLRYVMMLCVGHTLRFLTYISTTYPGSSEVCLGDVDSFKPRSMTEVFFTRFALKPGENCGDLLFSGHMMQMITPVLCIQHYGQSVFEYSAGSHRALLLFLWVCILLLGISIVIRRHHYTQDIVLGTYVTPLLWHFFNHVIHSKDAAPKSL